jgi:hypothetical protein
MDCLNTALERIDAANAEDPNVEHVDGAPRPKELIYGQRMSAWMARLRPDAPPALQIAARAQHVRRWDIPRDSFDMDRRGYLLWRKRLYAHHAEIASRILAELNTAPEIIERVAFLLQKRQLNSDPDTQSLEDAACLVFLEHHFDAFMQKTPPEKMIGIVQKTWNKMSEQAHAFALALPFSPEAQEIIGAALAPPVPPPGA